MDVPDLPDDVLVEQARTGDQAALSRLVTRHHQTAYRVALGIVGDPELAADAAQDAFLKAIRGLDGFRGDARFRTWLYTVTHNHITDYYRKHRVTVVADCNEGIETQITRAVVRDN